MGNNIGCCIEENSGGIIDRGKNMDEYDEEENIDILGRPINNKS